MVLACLAILFLGDPQLGLIERIETLVHVVALKDAHVLRRLQAAPRDADATTTLTVHSCGSSALLENLERQQAMEQ